MTMRDNERDALVRVSGDLQEYANGCNAIYLKELAARSEALAAPAEGGEVGLVDCPACLGRGDQGTGIEEAPTTTWRPWDRPEERRVGKEWVRPCRSRWRRCH